MKNHIQRRGMMFVLSSPSGGGKTTISRRLLENDSSLALSISVTTRPPRPGEVEGTHYHFVNDSVFDTWIAKGQFLEHATVFQYRYGTPRGPVEAALGQGTDVLFDIDWQGTHQLIEKARADVVSIFILPPSWKELEKRLRNRAQDQDHVIAHRMEKAMDEIKHWTEYDYVLINHDLDDSVRRVRNILEGERLKRHRQLGLIDFVNTLHS